MPAPQKGFFNYKYYINVQGDMADVTEEIISATYVALKTCEVSHTVYTTQPKKNKMILTQ